MFCYQTSLPLLPPTANLGMSYTGHMVWLCKRMGISLRVLCALDTYCSQWELRVHPLKKSWPSPPPPTLFCSVSEVLPSGLVVGLTVQITANQLHAQSGPDAVVSGVDADVAGYDWRVETIVFHPHCIHIPKEHLQDKGKEELSDTSLGRSRKIEQWVARRSPQVKYLLPASLQQDNSSGI